MIKAKNDPIIELRLLKEKRRDALRFLLKPFSAGLNSNEGLRFELWDCPKHGVCLRIFSYNEGGYNATYLCTECVKEFIDEHGEMIKELLLTDLDV
jgi:hypothetical protein